MKLERLAARLEVFTVLRSRDFRLYWSGHTITVVGLQMFNVALAWVIWELTRSEYLLGLVGLMEAAPAIALGLFGGALADKADLRRLLIWLQAITTAALLLLVVAAATEVVEVWHLFAVVFALGVLQVFDQPARQALFPNLVTREDLMKAVGLNAMVWPGVRIFGPAIAGAAIAGVGAVTGRPMMGVAAAFLVTAVGFGLFGWFLSLLRVPPIQRSAGKNMLVDIVAGLVFIWRQRLLAVLIALNFLAVFSITAYTTLLPVVATDILGGDAATLGILYTVGGIGSLSGALVAANLATYRRRGWLILGGAFITPVFLAMFAVSESLVLSLFLIALAGATNSVFSVSTQSTVHAMLPNEFRGRVMSVWSLNYSLVHPLGRLQMGTVAGFTRAQMPAMLGRLAGAPAAILLSCAVMALAILLVAVAIPIVRRLDARELAVVEAPEQPQRSGLPE